MKKTILTVGFLTLLHYGNSQVNFSLPYESNTEGLYNSSSVFFDADGDGDLDLIYQGGSLSANVCNLMLNNGTGQFTASSQTFAELYAGTISVGDINGDGDKDLFLAGANNQGTTVSKLYNNDGSGQFTENTNSNFFQFFAGDSEFFDSDGDGDMDLIVAGGDLTTSETAIKLYINNGSGNFTLAPEDFDGIGIAFTSISTADIDGDGDLDLHLNGQSSDGTTTGPILTLLFINNGGNTYTLSTQTFTGVVGGGQLFDVDNDNDVDLVLIGTTDNAGTVMAGELYINNGTGQFTLSTNTLPALVDNAMAVEDLDNDGDKDILLSGSDANSTLFIYFDNQGGNFVQIPGQPFIGFGIGSIAIGDINNDGFKDVFTCGLEPTSFISGFFLSNADAGVEVLAEGARISIAPNPIENGALHFSTDVEVLNGNISCKIVDVTGREVYANEMVYLMNDHHTIDVSDLESGNYLLIVENQGRQITTKFSIP